MSISSSSSQRFIILFPLFHVALSHLLNLFVQMAETLSYFLVDIFRIGWLTHPVSTKTNIKTITAFVTRFFFVGLFCYWKKEYAQRQSISFRLLLCFGIVRLSSVYFTVSMFEIRTMPTTHTMVRCQPLRFFFSPLSLCHCLDLNSHSLFTPFFVDFIMYATTRFVPYIQIFTCQTQIFEYSS